MNELNLNGAVMAYLGDAVFELAVRERLSKSGISDVGKLNATALEYVRATSQSKAVEAILPHLSEEELAEFKHGRNTHGISIPKSASAGEYRRATGLEALFGFLYLEGRTDRINELFEIAFPKNK